MSGSPTGPPRGPEPTSLQAARRPVPTALVGGLGAPQVEALRELIDCALQLPLGEPTADTFVLLKMVVLSFQQPVERHLRTVGPRVGERTDQP